MIAGASGGGAGGGASASDTAAASAGGTLDVLYSFEGTPDAEYPSTDLVLDGAGNLYGMTVLGGEHGSGTVFRLAPAPGGG